MYLPSKGQTHENRTPISHRNDRPKHRRRHRLPHKRRPKPSRLLATSSRAKHRRHLPTIQTITTMAKIIYNNQQYASIASLHRIIKPEITAGLLRQRIRAFKASGKNTTEAIKAALKDQKKSSKELTCTGCKQTKPSNQFQPHQTSLTGHKTRCKTCGPIKKINKPQQWANIIGSKPFGNMNQPVLVAI